MTVNSEVNRVAYVGSGIVGPFAIPYYFLANGDLRVIKKVIATGAESTLVLTTDYALTGAGDEAGGSLTLSTALSALYSITIIRDPARTQGADYSPNDDFPAETHERALDRLTMICQRLADICKRAFKAPESESGDQVLSGADWLARGGRVLGFDVGGAITTLAAVAGTSLVDLAASTGSSLVGFIHDAVGAVARSVQNRLRDTIHVTDFLTTAELTACKAADFSVVTNVNTALQAALTAAENKSLFIPGGLTLRHTTTLNLPQNCRILGEGRKSVIEGKVNTAAAFQTTSKHNITVENLCIKPEGTYSNVVTFTTCNNVRFKDVIYEGALTGGATQSSTFLRFYGCDRPTVDGGEIYDVDCGVYLDLSGGTLCDRVRIIDPYIEHRFLGVGNNPTGVYVLYCDRVRVDGIRSKNIAAGGGAPIAGYTVYEGDGSCNSLIVTGMDALMTTAKAHVAVQASTALYAEASGRMVGVAGGITHANYFFSGGGARSVCHVHDVYAKQACILFRGGAIGAGATKRAVARNVYIDKLEQSTAGIRFGVAGTGYIQHAEAVGCDYYAGYASGINFSECLTVHADKCRIQNYNTLNRMPTNTYAYTAGIYIQGAPTGEVENCIFQNDPSIPGDYGYIQYGIATDAAIEVKCDRNKFSGMLISDLVGGIRKHDEKYTAWTPSLGGNTTYNSRVGIYIKNGNSITYFFDIDVNVLGTGSPNDISGAPYAGAVSTVGTVEYHTGLALAPVMLACYETGGVIRLIGKGAAAANITNPYAALQNGSRILGQITVPLANPA